MKQQHLVLFRLEQQRLALPLEEVVRVAPLVAIDPLPGAPPLIAGMINVQGKPLPVLRLNQRFALEKGPPAFNDHLLLVKTSRRSLALLVSEVEGVASYDKEELTQPSPLDPPLEQVRGVARLNDSLLLIYNLEGCLSLEEEQQLEEALQSRQEQKEPGGASGE